ncbi:hypothetical protein U1Q18_002301, partial [Sarracenia purpurea var. burkii]
MAQIVTECEAKARGIAIEEWYKLSAELMEAKFENNQLTVRLQASERDRARERALGLSVLAQT